MDIYENLQKSMVIYGICPCLADDDYTFCKAKHLLMMPLHLETRNLVNNWYFSLNCNRGPYPLFIAKSCTEFLINARISLSWYQVNKQIQQIKLELVLDFFLFNFPHSNLFFKSTNLLDLPVAISSLTKIYQAHQGIKKIKLK